MKPDKTTAGLNVPAECNALFVGIENILVGARKDEKIIVDQVLLRKLRGVICNSYTKSVFGRQFLQCLDSGRNILMNITFAVFCVYEYIDLLPIYLSLRNGTSGDQQEDYSYASHPNKLLFLRKPYSY